MTRERKPRTPTTSAARAAIDAHRGLARRYVALELHLTHEEHVTLAAAANRAGLALAEYVRQVVGLD